MYGYIRPLKPELKIREFELYKAAYCGLCHSLGKSYGPLARFAVSYDCALPALMASADAGELCNKRCPAAFGRKKPCLCQKEGMELSAAATMLLLRHKLADTVRDSGFFKRTVSKTLLWLWKRKFARAEQTWPEFAQNAEACLAGLTETELSPPGRATVLDGSADCFAKVTAAFSLMRPEGTERRLWHEIYYHIGRVVYILDAADDFARDRKTKSYNPVLLRYDIPEGAELLPPDIREKLTETLELSLASAAAAFELLTPNAATPIVGNIIYLGLPETVSRVLNKTEKEKA
ncbi:MAG: hypothetical protein E7460_02030 [Ruminococcaceae bacterium]|nr:hypothetical protein [Oscillospiraceae bacterium]